MQWLVVHNVKLDGRKVRCQLSKEAYLLEYARVKRHCSKCRNDAGKRRGVYLAAATVMRVLLAVLYGLVRKGLGMGVSVLVSLAVSRGLRSTWSVAWGCE